jgi:class 3 adenylate cyclase
MLTVARAMAEAVAALTNKDLTENQETHAKLSCRIGIGMGPVLAGVLGKLQPRFHVFGKGAVDAEVHEQVSNKGRDVGKPCFFSCPFEIDPEDSVT